MVTMFVALVVSVLSHVCTVSSALTNQEIADKLASLEIEVTRLKAENENLRSENILTTGTIADLKKDAQNQKIYDQASITPSGQITALGAGRRLHNMEATVVDMQGAMDHMWLIICGALVMLMQAGFAMVESGCCRYKNVQNILLKNLVDVCMGTLCWWAFGWTLAYGFDSDNPDDVFAGKLQYFGHEFLEADDDGNQVVNGGLPRDWFFQWAFCATAATIVSGGVAERINFPVYILYTFCMTTFIYPVVVAWMWSSNGWLTPAASDGDKHLNQVGFNDFAGSGIVHMTGGIGALVGAAVSGPRKGRFDEDPAENFDPHNLPLVVLGTFILWFGWYGFNCGSTLGLSSTGAGQMAAVVAMNTTITASTAGLVVLILRLAITKKYDIGGMCNGILGGLVSITAGCGNVESGSAFAIGIIGGLVYQGSSMLLKMLKIDDPIDAFPVHGACGAWGVLAACFFDWGKGFDKYNGFQGGFGNAADLEGNTDGLWVSGFAAAVIEIIMIIIWVAPLSIIILLPFRLGGFLRVPDEVQDTGLDETKHSPPKAYNDPKPPIPAIQQQAYNEPKAATTVTAMTKVVPQ